MEVKITDNDARSGSVETVFSEKSINKVKRVEIERNRGNAITTKFGNSIGEKHKTDKWIKTNVIVAIVVGIFTIIGIVWGICS